MTRTVDAAKKSMTAGAKKITTTIAADERRSHFLFSALRRRLAGGGTYTKAYPEGVPRFGSWPYHSTKPKSRDKA